MSESTNKHEGLDLVQLMDRMHGIVVPEPIAMTPQTIGWQILGVWLVASVVILIVRQVSIYRKNQYRRDAIKELENIRNLPETQQASAIATLIKRTALVIAPRSEVAILSGDAWRAFLKSKASNIDDEALTRLAQCAYNPRLEGDLFTPAENWIRHHR